MSESHSRNKDLYHVAVKLFLRHGDKLLITHDIFKSWDLPGGRIKKDEFETSLVNVIKRKIQEELGEDFKYSVSTPTVFFRVKRTEQDGQEARIFAIGYEAKYLGGEIKLGKNHDQMEWVDVNTFKPDDYFTGGWLEGVKEYINRK